MLNCYNMYVKKLEKNFFEKVQQGGSEAITRTYGSPLLTRGGRRSLGSIDRLQEAMYYKRHFPKYYSFNGLRRKDSKKMSLCQNSNAQQRRKTVKSYCPESNLSLCINLCFKIYHTVQNF